MQKFKFINNRYFTIILYRRLISPPLEFQLSAYNSKISQLQSSFPLLIITFPYLLGAHGISPSISGGKKVKIDK